MSDLGSSRLADLQAKLQNYILGKGVSGDGGNLDGVLSLLVDGAPDGSMLLLRGWSMS